MGFVDLVVELLRGLAAWLRYTFDPEMVKRRDAINLDLMKEKNRAEIDKIMGSGNTISLGYFLSESLRWVRSQKTDHPTGRETNISDRILLRPRDEKSKSEDNNEGPNLG